VLKEHIPSYNVTVSIYVAMLTSHQPHRITQLMAYQNIVAKASAGYKWPLWVIYD